MKTGTFLDCRKDSDCPPDESCIQEACVVDDDEDDEDEGSRKYYNSDSECSANSI